MNITTSEIKYLMMMEKKGLHNVTEIAESLGISKPSVSVMVKKMITKDILKKNKKYIELTDTGKKYYDYYNELYEGIKNYFSSKGINDSGDNYVWLFISKINEEDITEQMVSDNLYTKGEPDPDLLIRTSGEIRLSNFLPWQLVYS